MTTAPISRDTVFVTTDAEWVDIFETYGAAFEVVRMNGDHPVMDQQTVRALVARQDWLRVTRPELVELAMVYGHLFVQQDGRTEVHVRPDWSHEEGWTYDLAPLGWEWVQWTLEQLDDDDDPVRVMDVVTRQR